MKGLTIKTNRALELVGAIERYIFNPEIIEQTRELGYQLSERLTAWFSQVDAEISPFLKNDLKLLRSLRWTQSVLSELVCSKELKTAVELLDQFREMEAREFLRLYLKEFHYEWDGQTSLDFTRLESHLHERLERDQVTSILEIIPYPEEMKERVYQAYRAFYERFVAPYEEEVSQYLAQKIVEHQQLYAENPDSFIRTILLTDAETWQKFDMYEVQIYAVYYQELSVEVIPCENKRFFIYGITMEQRYALERQAERQKQLFKVLADEKRVEILKLLSEREWYGNELAKHFGLTTATMSYHISKLMDLEVITMTEGEQNRFYYRLQKERLRTLFLDVLEDLLGEKKVRG